MLGQRRSPLLVSLFQPKPFNLQTTNIIVNILFSEDVLNTKVFNLKRYIEHVHKDIILAALCTPELKKQLNDGVIYNDVK